MNRIYVWGVIVITILLFSLFKYFYPYPNMVMDSYVYIKAAALHMSANSAPIGYSWFLRAFSFFSRSAYLLVMVQYFFLEFSCAVLFFTLLHLFHLSRLFSTILFIFLFCNPLFLYLSNFVMSDSLFTAISVLWITQLIWIICAPRTYMILVHTLLIFLAFTVRYNALYYPLFASIVLLVIRLKVWQKITAILLQFVLIVLFIFHVKNSMFPMTKVRQFPPLCGWQMANNVMYMYGHVDRNTKGTVPDQFSILDSVVRHDFDSAGHVEDILDYSAEAHGFYYMASNGSPLNYYFHWQYGYDSVFQDLTKRGPASILFTGYAKYLILKYPVQYIRYWAIPNGIRYFYPPTEIFSMISPYIMRRDAFGGMATELLDVKTLMVRSGLIGFRTTILNYYSMFFMLLNLLFLLLFAGFFFLGGFKNISKSHTYVLISIALLWCCNLFFSAMVSCCVLRYEVFIMIMIFSFTSLLLDFIYRMNSTSKGKFLF